jgi:quinol monooxygenase YgiN
LEERMRASGLAMSCRAAGGLTDTNERTHERETPVIIVAGALIVGPDGRDAYLDGCVSVVAAARQAQGCLDFALSSELLELSRINVYERWESTEDLHRFRGSGPDADQLAAPLNVQVNEYAVVERPRAAGGG